MSSDWNYPLSSLSHIYVLLAHIKCRRAAWQAEKWAGTDMSKNLKDRVRDPAL